MDTSRNTEGAQDDAGSSGTAPPPNQRACPYYDIDGGRQSPFSDDDDYDSCCGPPGHWERHWEQTHQRSELVSDIILPGLSQGVIHMDLLGEDPIEVEDPMNDSSGDRMDVGLVVKGRKFLPLKRPAGSALDTLDWSVRKSARPTLTGIPFRFDR